MKIIKNLDDWKKEKGKPDIRGDIEKVLSGKGKIIDGAMYSAAEKARSLLEAAESEAARIKREAEEEKEEERKRGYEEGYEAGKSEVTSIMLEARREYGKLLEKGKSDIIKLSMRVAKKIIGYELKMNPRTILKIVTQAVGAVRQQQEIIVRVHPGELEYLIGKEKQLMGMLGRAKSLSFRGDENIPRGGCIIDTEIGQIDAKLNTQLKTIQEFLLKN